MRRHKQGNNRGVSPATGFIGKVEVSRRRIRREVSWKDSAPAEPLKA